MLPLSSSIPNTGEKREGGREREGERERGRKGGRERRERGDCNLSVPTLHILHHIVWSAIVLYPPP